MDSSTRQRPYLFLATAYVLAAVAVGLAIFAPPSWNLGWNRPHRLPRPGDPTYEEYVEAFELGLAEMDAGNAEMAEEHFTRATKLIPQEPAAWMNLALLHIRLNRLPAAESDLAEAEKLSPNHPALALIRAEREERLGNSAEVVTNLRKVVANDPTDLKALYSLAENIRREDKPDCDAEYQQLMEQILALRPQNRHALNERLKTAFRRADRPAVSDCLARLRLDASNWTQEEVRYWFAEFEKAAVGPLDSASDPCLAFTNIYRLESGYRHDANELTAEYWNLGRPVRNFVKLAPARHTPASPDSWLKFTPEPLADVPAGKWDVAVPVWLTSEGNPVVFVANAKEVRRAGSPAVLPPIALAPDGLVPVDWNNDFRTDLLLVGNGLVFYQQGLDGNFTDVTATTKLPPEILKGEYSAALAVDVDLDGALDILLARKNGPPVFLRNNFHFLRDNPDSTFTFTPLPIFPEVKDARAFAWADLDHDGAPDAIILDAQGKLHVYFNGSAGRFLPAPAPLPDGPFLAVTVADADEDGVLDVIALRADGTILRISERDRRARWSVKRLGRWEVPPGAAVGSIRLFTDDLDNNGVPDIIVSGPSGGAVWLGSGNGSFKRLSTAIPSRTLAATDFNNTGRLDLLCLDSEGRPIRLRNTGKKNHHWISVRVRGAQCPPDGWHTNSFAIGSEVEIRTGTHAVKRPVTSPVVHVGLGYRTRCDVIRATWPNEQGHPRIEFNRRIDRTVTVEQPVKGW